MKIRISALLLALMAAACGSKEESVPETTSPAKVEEPTDEPLAYVPDADGNLIPFARSIEAYELPRYVYEDEAVIVRELGVCYAEGYCLIKRACYRDDGDIVCLQHKLVFEDRMLVEVITEPAADTK